MIGIERLAAILLAAASTAAHAIPVRSATTDAVSFHHCIPGTTSGCDQISQPPFEVIYGGAPGLAIASASGSIAGMGSGESSVALSGVIGAPIFHGYATSSPGVRVNTTALALQSFTYSGTVATTRTFGGTLSYSQSLTGIYPGGNGNGVYAEIDLFTIAASSVDVGNTTESNFAALVQTPSLPGYVDQGDQSFSDTASTAHGAGVLGVTVTLQPGETIWALVSLSTPAPNGDVVDAAHTFVTSWDDSSNLTSASAVPEASSLNLMSAGLAVLAIALRCRRKAGVRRV